MQQAHEDPGVEEIASRLLQVDGSRRRLLTFTLLSFAEFPVEPTLDAHASRLETDQQDDARAIRSRVEVWRRSLTDDAFNARKGAIIERLVARLEALRHGANVLGECRLLATNGGECGPFDVLASGLPIWEALECKSGVQLSFQQAKELNFAAGLAEANTNEFLVVFASAASRYAVRAAIINEVEHPERIYIVSAETIHLLGVAPPHDTAA